MSKLFRCAAALCRAHALVLHPGRPPRRRGAACRRPARVAAALLPILLALAGNAQAGHGNDGFPPPRQTAWSFQQGAPADVWALAQGRDGYLWLGTGNGLYRFDGDRFERFAPTPGEAFRSANITALAMQPDGALWIGFYVGGASLLRDGHLTHYTERAGFPEGMVNDFARTADGALWAASSGGLVRWQDGRWRVAGDDWGYPTRHADWALTDRHGTLWVATGRELVFLRPGARRFEHTGVELSTYAVIAQAPDGTLWVSDNLRGTRALPGLTAEHPSAPDTPRVAGTDVVRSRRLLFDRDGTLWGADLGRGGVHRLFHPEREADGHTLRTADLDQYFDRSQGLASNVTDPLLEDAEGTVWVGSNLGLNSFRYSSVDVPAGLPVGTPDSAALAAGRGPVWIGTGGTLYHAAGKAAEIVARGLPGIDDACLGADGVLWLSATGRLLRVIDGVPAAVATPSAGHERIRAFASDNHGGLWVAFEQQGLYHWHDGAWTPQRPGLGLDPHTPTVLAVDAADRLWAGYRDGRLARFGRDGTRIYAAADGLDVGSLGALEVTAGDVLAGGEFGVARLQGDAFQGLDAGDPRVLAGASGIVRTGRGEVWINASRGAVRIEAAALRRAAADPAHRVDYRLFDYHDGLPGVALQLTASPTAVLDGGQRVWLATNQGVVLIDPAAIRLNRRPPPVLIEAVLAGGSTYAPAAGLRLPERTGNIEVRYTATSLASPDRVQFRYRLEGVDGAWQDAGNRRAAFYSNLGPGRYRFRVIAANDDGVWNEQGAAIDFTIPPRYFQTWWFYGLCALAALGLIALLYAWRLRLASERLRLRFEARMLERESIARDLHDTLLQGVQGLLLSLQTQVVTLRPDDARRGALDAAIRQAREMVTEGRDKIVTLRGHADGELMGLVQSVQVIGENLAAIHGPAFGVSVAGAERPLCLGAQMEILEIVREGLRNAFIHARAARIEADIRYSAASLRITVRDDGRGLDEAVLREGRRAGHWGLVGMRERAERLGARLALRPGTPRGTELELTVPARVAFELPPQGGWWSRLWCRLRSQDYY
ncbi:sensor histidine kinase [Frateuria defendens]|uniref:sensor histidine kinase n=1 Tax=Frateuria defendens TaxID=2219559 RepID=UPI00066FDB80|nr:sensor histidine kinase [Frateuria defendens]